MSPAFNPVPPLSLRGLRTLQGQSIPWCPAGVDVFAELTQIARGDCSTMCGHTSCLLLAGLVSNFCPFPLPQGLPSPRFRNRHSAASHPAAHLLKNRYAGAAGSPHRKQVWRLCPVGARGLPSRLGSWVAVWVCIPFFPVGKEAEAQFMQRLHPP